MLNSPYGKLGQYAREYPSHSFQLVDGKYVEEIEAMTTGGNAGAELAAASFITAYGRVYLARTINKIGLDNFLYCDTDSVHIKGHWSDQEMLERGVEVDDHKLGAWKLESQWDRAKFIKCKTYGERIVGSDCVAQWHSTTAGLSRQIAEEDFAVGHKVQDKRSFAAQGGTVIVDKWLTIGGADVDDAESRVKQRDTLGKYMKQWYDSAARFDGYVPSDSHRRRVEAHMRAWYEGIKQAREADQQATKIYKVGSVTREQLESDKKAASEEGFDRDHRERWAFERQMRKAGALAAG